MGEEREGDRGDTQQKVIQPDRPHPFIPVRSPVISSIPPFLSLLLQADLFAQSPLDSAPKAVENTAYVNNMSASSLPERLVYPEIHRV